MTDLFTTWLLQSDQQRWGKNFATMQTNKQIWNTNNQLLSTPRDGDGEGGGKIEDWCTLEDGNNKRGWKVILPRLVNPYPSPPPARDWFKDYNSNWYIYWLINDVMTRDKITLCFGHNVWFYRGVCDGMASINLELRSIRLNREK